MNRIIHTFKQGDKEWLAFRPGHRGASEAAAALGISSNTTRTELLHMKHTGFGKEFTDWVQKNILDYGHEVEAKARRLIEEDIGEDLYPMTISIGLLSASCDGLTMDETMAWEHKQWNEALAESVRNGVLPDEYMPQCQQIMHVTGATTVMFTVSDGTRENRESMKVYPDAKWISRILAAWKQFEEDLAVYVPAEITVPVVAAPQLGLPAVSIVVNGSIALVDNLDKFGQALKAYVERINKKPETDEDFANLEESVKTLKKAEDALDAAESGALAQTDSIDTMRKTVALYRETARTNRLLIEKLVKAEKESRRTAIISEAAAELHTHIRKCNDRIGKPYMPSIAADFAGVVKGLKSLDSMKDKVSVELARCKIASNEAADRIQANLETKGLHGYAFLFADIATLCLKPSEDFQNTVTARITQHEAQEAARMESEREKIHAEEQAKAQREAAAEAVRVAAEQMAQAAAIREANELAFKDAVGAGTGITKTAVTTEQVQVTHVPVVNIIPMTRPAPTTSAPTLKLGDIADRLGFSLNADFLANLGFEATRVKSACLFQERDFPLMLMRLVAHIQHVQSKQAA